MKKLLYFFMSVCMALGFVSCKEDPLMNYEGSENIYFYAPFKAGMNPSAGQYPFADSITLSMAFFPQLADTVLQIPVAFTGLLANHDRDFLLEVDPASTAIANAHYQLGNRFSVRAGRYVDSLQVKVLQDASDTSSYNLILRLQPNANFSTEMLKYKVPGLLSFAGECNTTRLSILISYTLERPNRWLDEYFGAWSKKKHQLVCQVNGVPVSIFESITQAQWSAYSTATKLYLAAEKAAGRTVYEADGVTEMAMGANA